MIPDNIYDLLGDALRPNELAKIAQIKAAIQCQKDCKLILNNIGIDYNETIELIIDSLEYELKKLQS